MRTKSKLTHKRGLHMQVILSPVDSDTTAIEVVSVDPEKAEKAAKRIRKYLEALDQRLD
jgi:hypothetical protein